LLPTSLSLLDRLRESSEARDWQRLVELYTPLIRHWLGRASLQASDAEDLTQEVLTTLVRELPNFRHDGRPGSFRVWLRLITVNRLHEFWRAQRHRPDATGDTGLAEMLARLEDPASELSRLWDQEHDQHVAHRMLELIAADFAPSTWQAFQRLLSGEEPAAVAKALGLTKNAVLIAKSRVLARLRQEMKELLD
jgi:RNA polymerase sigma-70 factor (ECF subfamily)